MGKKGRSLLLLITRDQEWKKNLIINFSTTIYVSMFFVLSVERMCSMFTLSMTVTSNIAH